MYAGGARAGYGGAAASPQQPNAYQLGVVAVTNASNFYRKYQQVLAAGPVTDFTMLHSALAQYECV
jgi:hypothetical protein